MPEEKTASLYTTLLDVGGFASIIRAKIKAARCFLIRHDGDTMKR
jgi:hypothetical protein